MTPYNPTIPRIQAAVANAPTVAADARRIYAASESLIASIMVRPPNVERAGSTSWMAAVTVGRRVSAASEVRATTAKPLVGSCANATYMVGGVGASSAASL